MDLQNCLFCRKVDDKRQLLSIKFIVEELECDLASISLEVLNVLPKNDGLLCSECKKQLIDSYKFVKRAQLCFGSDSRSKIIKSVHEFLNESEQLDSFSVMGFNTCFAIVSAHEKAYMEYQGWQDLAGEKVICIDDDDEEEDDEPAQYSCEIDIKEEQFAEHVAETSTSQNGERQYKRKPSPLWLKQMIKKCKKVSKSERGVVSLWRCCECSDVSYISYSGLKLHLLKTHMKNTDKLPTTTVKSSLKIEQAVGFDQDPFLELLSDNNFEAQNGFAATVDSGDDDEVEEQNLNPPNANKEREWVEKMIKRSEIVEDGQMSWLCVICKDMKCNTLFGMKIHIVRKHRNKIREVPNEPGLEKFKKKFFTLNGVANVWVCSSCENSVFNSEAEMQAHISSEHPAEIEDEQFSVIKCRRSKSEQNKPLLELIHRSKVVTPGGIHYVCTTCDDSFVSYQNIRYHILTRHLNNPTGDSAHSSSLVLNDLEQFNSEPMYDEQDTTLNDSKRCIKASEMTAQEKDWLRSFMKHSRVKNESENCWKCIYCAKMYTVNSTMRYHVLMSHFPLWQQGPEMFAQHLQNIGSSYVEDEAVKSDDEMSNDVTSNDATIAIEDSPKPQVVLKTSNMGVDEKTWLKKSMQKSTISMGSEDFYQCWICAKNLTSYQNTRYHLLAKHMPAWKLGRVSFGNHVKTCQDTGSPPPKLSSEKLDGMRCNFCHFQYRRQEEYQVHMNIHRVTDPLAAKMSFQLCGLCPMRFSTFETLQQHIAIHQKKEKSQPVPLEGFGIHKKLPENILTVQKHIEIETWPFACGHCAKKFEAEIDLNRHIMLFHMNPIVCPLDQRQFSGSVSIVNHVNSTHSELLGIIQTCPHCKKEFDDQIGKINHLKTCDQRKLQCDCCHKRFGQKATLLRHLKLQLDIKDFSCHVCGKSYVSNADLESHVMRVHSDNKKMYNCTMCNKSFTSISYLVKHMEAHEGNTYSCDTCTSTFNTRKNLEFHKKQKHDEAYRQQMFIRHSCSICMKSFMNNYRVKRHMQLSHGVDLALLKSA